MDNNTTESGVPSNFVAAISTISGLAIAVNTLLLFLIFKCRSASIIVYKYFFIAGALQNLILALVILLLTPISICAGTTYIYVAVGVASEWKLLAQPLLIILITAFMSTFLIVANDFVYRYVYFCKSHLLYVYSSTKWLLVLAAVNIALIGNWNALVINSINQSTKLMEYKRENLIMYYNIDITSRTFLGISLEFTTKPMLVLLVGNTVVVQILAVIVSQCARKVIHWLGQNSISYQTKKLHRKMLILLFVQTACPTLMLHLPSLLILFVIFTGLNCPISTTCISTYVNSLFSLLSPIIVIFFTTDYRNFLFSMFKLRKSSVVRNVITINPNIQ
ncbi:hypothetical protein V3C99_013180 [Haemonchus contortus]|uniref:G_PROTEIN_RECEP_F1_2 domain-containing protein n=1 Tax=Haemonchus contortus TaxID=6289 RepID=A0A7I4Y3H2_HAECO